MLKPQDFFVIGTLAFIVWAFSAESPNARIDRICSPVELASRAGYSVASFFGPEQALKTRAVLDRGVYMCEFGVWKMLYESEYVETLSADGDTGEAGTQGGGDE